MDTFGTSTPVTESEAYQKLIDSIQRHTKYPLSEEEKHEAARNLIAFFKVMIEIRRQLQEDQKHDKQN